MIAQTRRTILIPAFDYLYCTHEIQAAYYYSMPFLLV